MNDEAARDAELNLFIGEFRIPAPDLPEGMSVRRGDEIIVHWQVNESQNLSADVEIPSVALGSFAVSTGDKSFIARIDDTDDAPFTLSELALRNPSIGAGELDGLVEALEAASFRRSAGWASAVFVPAARFVILTAELDGENRRATIMGVISGGVTDPGLAPARIRALNPWLTAASRAVSGVHGASCWPMVRRRLRPVRVR